MLILLIAVVYRLYGLWGGHRRVEYVQDLVGLDGVWLCHLFGGCFVLIKGREDIISDGLSWISIDFLLSGVG